MRLRLLGPVEVVDDAGRPVDVGGRKERALLAVLALRAGEVVSEDALVDALWGGAPPRTATKTLQAYVSRLRKALAGTSDLVVESHRPGYVLQVGVCALDVGEVQRLADEARASSRQGDVAGCAGLLAAAERLWRGVPLGDLADEPWAQSEVARLEELRLALAADRVDAELASGRHAAVVGELEGWCAAHPLRERFWAQRMLALYRSGRQADALAAYQHLRHTLATELGLDPSPELQELERRILEQDPSLRLVSAAPALEPTLPQGVVTLLLTDVEGSSALWERHPEVMATLLARHDEIVAAVVREHEGVALKTRGEGDSTFSVFGSVANAVNAGIALQRALRAETSSSEITLRVRVALHTGEPELRDGDYFGPVCNRAARLRAVAHGGQVLCSHSTAQLLEDVLPLGLSLRDLGTHRLQDLARPEQIFEVVDPELPETFPSLRSLESWPNNLPVQLTSFIGREQELDELRQVLADNRLVTLTGSAGCGKTRLAVQLGAERLQDYPEGVWLVDLAPLNDADLLVHTVATTLGVRETPTIAMSAVSNTASARTMGDILLDHLRARSTLLILDNCEHLLDSAAELAEAVIRTCPGVRVLATSREALGLAGEVSWRVRSLSVPERGSPSSPQQLVDYEAVRLFVDRARSCLPSFALSERDAPAVAAICRRLDGIPLAIELAASRVEVLTPQELADRLDDRFRVLTGGGRRGVERHQTLRAAVDWSYEALSATEQTLLGRLSVFSAGATLAATETVCTGDGLRPDDVLDLLSRLVAKSLVLLDRDATPARYRMLETIRQYAWEKLGPDEAERQRGRHLQWCLELTAQAERGMWGSQQTQWFNALEAEEDNIRQALEWTIGGGDAEHALALVGALGRFWMVRRRVDEGLRWTLDALALDGSEFPYPRAKALTSCALTLVGYFGAYAEAARLALEALELFRRLGGRRGTFWALHTVSLAALFQGDVATAITYGDEALTVAREAGYPDVLAYALLNRADVAIAEGEFATVDALLSEALPIVRATGDHIALVRLVGVQGYVAMRAGNYAAAAPYLEEAVARSREIGDDSAIVWALTNLGCVALVIGDHAAAREWFAKAAAAMNAATIVSGVALPTASSGVRAGSVSYPAAVTAGQYPQVIHGVGPLNPSAARGLAAAGLLTLPPHVAVTANAGAPGVESLFLDIFLLNGLAELALAEDDIDHASATLALALERLTVDDVAAATATAPALPLTGGLAPPSGGFIGVAAANLHIVSERRKVLAREVLASSGDPGFAGTRGIGDQVLLPSLLVAIAKVAIAAGVCRPAATLLGAAEQLRAQAIALHRQGRWVLADHLLEEMTDRARSALGTTGFDNEVAAGRATPPEAVMGLASTALAAVRRTLEVPTPQESP